MTSTPVPSKEWMTLNRSSSQYINGVDSFIQYAKGMKGGDKDWYQCPCVKCKNFCSNTSEKIREHLICNGIVRTYTTWFAHGETSKTNYHQADTSTASTSETPTTVQMIHDTFSKFSDDIDAVFEPQTEEEHNEPQTEEEHSEPQPTGYQQSLEDAMQPLYPSCPTEHTKLSVTVELLSMKQTNSWSDKSFTTLLQFLKKILPESNTLPDGTYSAKKLVKNLRMEYEIIHACRNDCILYWKEFATLDVCPVCNESRWDKNSATTKRLPVKKLRYFPLAPRLQRLYSIPWIADEMTWHSKVDKNFTHMRHPMDSLQWSTINNTWKEFATEKRNVRLGLATDGFNPFGQKNNSYSCWPVMIVPYNLPPSLCMRKEFTMLSLLIPGKNGPGHDIDVYLQPLIAELNQLWHSGIDTYDSKSKSTFTMKAILMWAIHDFPAYGHLSGCRTAGKFGCPVCSVETESVWLENGNFFAYMGHRKFLISSLHPFRLQKSQFNGNEDKRRAPRRMTGSEVLSKIADMKNIFGKSTGKKRKRSGNVESAWSKKSIFFELPYWKDLHLRHNLDVMHIEKNVTENIFATIMDVKGKTKDGIEARRDLQSMKIRRKLWPFERDGKEYIPKAPFCLSREERQLICQTLHSLKVPIGYSASWKNNVCLEEFQLKSLKSHDYHILMQQLLPVLLMHCFKEHKPLRAALQQLSTFFNVLCSKVMDIHQLTSMKTQMIEILCVFEKYFPPSFFVSMIHLCVHLAEEALLCGPVRYRWMYPFERLMKTYKSYVGNQTYPEGCIAERYLMQESMSYCMEYMTPGHKILDDEYNDGPVNKTEKTYVLDHVQYEQVTRWVIERSPDNDTWNSAYQKYKNIYATRNRQRRSADKFLNYVTWLRNNYDISEMSRFKRLINGPDFNAISYTSYRVNGYIFCTADSEKNATTQNSGVTIDAITQFRSSTRDKNPVEKMVSYYGIIRQILQLNYFDFKEVVFYCDWVRIENANGYYIDKDTQLRYVNLARFRSTSRAENDEPFILANEAKQVFYVKDVSRDDWYVVLDAPKKLNRDVDAYEEPLVVQARMEGNPNQTMIVEDVLDYNDTEVA